jgi:hypothetical protein
LKEQAFIKKVISLFILPLFFLILFTVSVCQKENKIIDVAENMVPVVNSGLGVVTIFGLCRCFQKASSRCVL